MANDTADAMGAGGREAAAIFDQACRAYGDSLKVMMKAQEKTIKFWGEAVGTADPMPALASELIPVAQKNTDKYLRQMETSYRRGADHLKKAIPTQNGSDGVDLRKHTRDWWEASIEVARDNAQDWAGTNLRVVQAWTDAFKKGAPEKAAVEK
jgi:hypothetical protein